MHGHVRVGGSWKTVSSPSVKVGGSWKSVSAGFTRVGGAWKQWYTASTSGVFDLLETQTLSGTAASVTFSNLNSTYSNTYQHLQVRVSARTNRSGVGDFMFARFNGDSGNARCHALFTNGSSIASQTATPIEIGRITGDTATANVFGAVIVDILDPFETTKNTTLRALGGLNASTSEVHFTSGAWFSNDAVTSFYLQPGNGTNFLAGSRFSLYGIRRANV